MKIKIKSIISDLDITPLLRFLLQRNSPISSSYLFSFFLHFSSTLLKYLLSSICLSPFYFFQFFSNLFKYSSSNFRSSHPYNIFAMNFPGSSLLLKSLSSAISIFSCFLTSTLIFSSNSFMACSAFFKFFILSQVSPSAVNPFLSRSLMMNLIFIFISFSFILFFYF